PEDRRPAPAACCPKPTSTPAPGNPRRILYGIKNLRGGRPPAVRLPGVLTCGSLLSASAGRGSLAERADGEQAIVAAELSSRRLDDERGAEEVRDLRPGGWYTQRLPLRRGKDLATHPVRRARGSRIPDRS